MPGGERQEKVLRMVLFPAPYQGHITPMLQLAALLHSQGVSITIAHSRYRSPKTDDFPDFEFEPIWDGLSEDEASTKDIIDLSTAINVNCEAPFRDFMARKLLENEENQIVCIISDAFMHFSQRVADQLKIPRIALWTCNATCFLAFPLLPVQDHQSEAIVPELPILRIKDLPDILLDNPKTWYKLLEDAYNQIRASDGIIINSYEHLEEMAVMKIRQECQVPIFLVGPLHGYSTSSSSSLLVQDEKCMDWLDKQAPSSVIYVSFGSLTILPKTELPEIAWGLANSKQPFLWVVRSGLFEGSEQVELPVGFEEETRNRGLLVQWAPQQELLAHPAVGGFWTHSGWNSTLQSICGGVPMLCSPSFGDQKVNARMVSHVWKVGMQLENGPERGEIERAIRKLMMEKEGQEMRERAKKLKEDAEDCLRKGGASYKSTRSLIDFIL